MNNNEITIDVCNINQKNYNFDFDTIIYDLDTKLDLLSSKADKLDYLVSISSGLLCGALDILWTGEFNLAEGRNIASDKVEKGVIKTANIFNKGKKVDSLPEAVKILEKNFRIPSDGNTPDFGGGLQHHLRDFAHHPTIVGLIFSLLTQFTEKSYGTDTNGIFKIVNVPEQSKIFIGKNVPDKIFRGTIIWLFHMISDIAGSGKTAGMSGGTGLPGPLLSLIKEISALPFISKIASVSKKNKITLSQLISKFFNGTIFAQRDANGKVIPGTEIKFDYRGELGLGIEIGKQALPVVANDCIVRTFYFIRRLFTEIKNKNITSLSDFKLIDLKNVSPINNPTISRMLLVATSVFTTVDITDAIIKQTFWVSINYVGIGRFAIALGEELVWMYRRRQIQKLKDMYETIERNTYRQQDNNIYKGLADLFN